MYMRLFRRLLSQRRLCMVGIPVVLRDLSPNHVHLHMQINGVWNDPFAGRRGGMGRSHIGSASYAKDIQTMEKEGLERGGVNTRIKPTRTADPMIGITTNKRRRGSSVVDEPFPYRHISQAHGF